MYCRLSCSLLCTIKKMRRWKTGACVSKNLPPGLCRQGLSVAALWPSTCFAFEPLSPLPLQSIDSIPLDLLQGHLFHLLIINKNYVMLTQAVHPPKPVREPTGFSSVSIDTASSLNIHKGAYTVNCMRINQV